jgi:hypothetical protein
MNEVNIAQRILDIIFTNYLSAVGMPIGAVVALMSPGREELGAAL